MSEYKTLTEMANAVNRQPTRYEAALLDEIERLRGLHGLLSEARQYITAYQLQCDTVGGLPHATNLAARIDAALAGAAVQPNDATERTGIEFLHLWMRTPNPMLGNVSPLDMMDSGRGERLADFIRDAADANE